MFAVFQSCADSPRLSPHRDDWKIEQNLINLETAQVYMAGTGVKRYCRKTIEDLRKELDGEGKASLKRSPNGPQCDVHVACMDWAGINGNSMEDIVRVVELKRIKARVFHSRLGFCSVGVEKDTHDQREVQLSTAQ